MNQVNKSFKLFFVDISKQFRDLDKHFIWMFIATIGCWGIPSAIAQPIAIFLVLCITIYHLDSLIKKKIEQGSKRFNAIKDMYGQHLTASRLKLVKRKMRQIVIQKLWITVSCVIFVLLSFFLIGVKFGRDLKIAHQSDKILEFFL